MEVVEESDFVLSPMINRFLGFSNASCDGEKFQKSVPDPLEITWLIFCCLSSCTVFVAEESVDSNRESVSTILNKSKSELFIGK